MAKFARLSDEQVKKLTPEAKIKYLKLLEESRKKELEEEQKRVAQEIEEAEEQIKETQEQIAEEQEIEEILERPRRTTDDTDLERKLLDAAISEKNTSSQYKTGSDYESPLVRDLPRDGGLDRLSYSRESSTYERSEQGYKPNESQSLYTGPEAKKRTESGLSSEILQNMYKR